MNNTETNEMVRIPRLVIAGIHSNCGKTTVARGLMAALALRGFVVQPFKVGPDFIDPSHHTRICGRISRNLDPVMMGEDEVKRTFVRACHGADIAVIEGVMGMYDGIDGTTYGSTAHIARQLRAPVILVIPVRGMSGSVHAIAEGFKNHEPDSELCGVILNMVGSPRHRSLLQVGKSVEQLGFIPVSEELSISSRHLGLHMAEETEVSPCLVQIIEEYCDLQALVEVSRKAPPLPVTTPDKRDDSSQARIAIASDPAFCFYYQDNLDKLRDLGGELIYFSPLTDNLPEADLLYLGGGYPELHAHTLAKGPAIRGIREACDDGMPIYAECGGLMYLGRGLTSDEAGMDPVQWVGILPGEARMEKRFQALGYTIGTFSGGPSVALPGSEVRGHEFHYSRIIPDRDARYAITLSRGTGITDSMDGMYVHNCMGAYTHAYFSWKNAREFISAASAYHREK